MFGHDDQDENNQTHNEHQQNDQPTDDVIKPAAADDNWQHPGPPPSDSDDSDSPDKAEEDKDTDVAPASPIDMPTPEPAGDSVDNDLIDLKQEALTKLSPLVGHLDQTPDEKFRTLMMMIQASDDQALVKQAYETALKIDDEKERAQALLDIVNEINYFTQNSSAKPE
jgi:hypothetical protein